MTTWSIQYGDEAGNQHTRTTDDIGEVHATLEVIVADDERTVGYAGQTATWHGYNSRDEDPYATGNWSLSVVNLDTHTADGYTLEEAAEFDATDSENKYPQFDDEPETETETVPSTQERAAVLMSMLYGLTTLNNSKPNMFVEWTGGADDPIIIRQTSGWTLTLDVWSVHLYPDTSQVVIAHDDDEQTFPIMDALVHLGGIILKY